MRNASHSQRAAVLCLVIGILLGNAGVSAAGLSRFLVWEESLKGTEDLAMRWPVAVAAASDRELAVADAFEPKVMLFQKVGVSWQFSKAVDLPAAPVAMVHDGTRYIVAMRNDQGLVALEGDQHLQRKLGLPRGVVPGPMAVGEDGQLFVFDYAGKNIFRLRADGAVAGTISTQGNVTALAAGPGGVVFAAIAQDGAIERYNAGGSLAERWEVPGTDPIPAWPSAIAVVGTGELAVVDRHGGRIVLLDENGRASGVGSGPGSEPGLLKHPSGILNAPDGRLLVVDGGNGRVQAFRRSD